MRLWRILNILSVDVALGAVASSAFFAEILGAPLRIHAYLSLGLIVWTVYTVDHLLDALRTTFEPSSQRHRFHLRHQKPLAVAVIVAIGVIALMAFLVRSPVLIAGIGVAALVIIYLGFQRSLRHFKELAIGLLYTAGVVSAPLAVLRREPTTNEMFFIAAFFLTAFANLTIFSLYGQHSDLADGHYSLATRFGRNATRRTSLFTADSLFNFYNQAGPIRRKSRPLVDARTDECGPLCDFVFARIFCRERPIPPHR